MKSSLTLLSLTVMLLAGCAGHDTTAYHTNPVIRGDVPDPSVIRIDDTYYLAGTSSEWAPHYPLFESKDLVNWTPIGHVFAEKPEWTSSSFWAPELFYHNGTTYCYYTARRASDGISCIGVATTKNIGEGFEDHGVIVEHGNEAIDAFVFDDDGQLYISWKAYGLANRPIEIIGSKLSADGLRLEGEPFTMLRDDDRMGMEGQYHFKEGDYYYLVYAVKGCCGPGSDYETYVARSERFEGPYEKYVGNPILIGGDNYLSCGHGTGVVAPNGRRFFICHAYLPGAGFYQGRQPILEKMYVGEDKWVHFTCGDTASLKRPMPFKGTLQRTREGFEDRFESKKLNPQWSWNYVSSDARIDIRDGKLLLGGKMKEGNVGGTVLCLRPESVDYTVETQVYDTPDGLQGLTMYGADRYMLAWGISQGKLILNSLIGNRDTTMAEIDYEGSSVYLRIKVHGGRFCEFWWSADGENWQKAEADNTESLTRWDRVARPGMFYRGNGAGTFEYFKMNLL